MRQIVIKLLTQPPQVEGRVVPADMILETDIPPVAVLEVLINSFIATAKPVLLNWSKEDRDSSVFKYNLDLMLAIMEVRNKLDPKLTEIEDGKPTT